MACKLFFFLDSFFNRHSFHVFKRRKSHFLNSFFSLQCKSVFGRKRNSKGVKKNPNGKWQLGKRKKRPNTFAVFQLKWHVELILFHLSQRLSIQACSSELVSVGCSSQTKCSLRREHSNDIERLLNVHLFRSRQFSNWMWFSMSVMFGVNCIWTKLMCVRCIWRWLEGKTHAIVDRNFCGNATLGRLSISFHTFYLENQPNGLKLEHCFNGNGMFEFKPWQNPMELFNKIELFRSAKEWEKHKITNSTLWADDEHFSRARVFIRMHVRKNRYDMKQAFCNVLKCKYLITFATILAAL